MASKIEIELARKKIDETRGRGGANKSSYLSNVSILVCAICGRECDTDDGMIVAHSLTDEKPGHIDICSQCDIPEGYWGCGCGG